MILWSAGTAGSRALRTSLLGALLALAISGCGQKGPLYLPTPQKSGVPTTPGATPQATPQNAPTAPADTTPSNTDTPPAADAGAAPPSVTAPKLIALPA